MDNTREKAVLKQVDILTDEIVSLTQRMIRIPSLSGQEGQIQSFLERELKEIGFGVWRHGKVESRPNLLATLKGVKDSPEILFVGHVDNISADNQQDWQYPPYEAHIEHGRIFGRGAADMKAGLAAMIMAGKAIKQSGISLNGAYSIAAVVDEEVESEYGMKYLAEQRLIHADSAIFCEPSFPDIVTALKGGVWLRITTFGRAVGSGWPDQGVNAVMKMAKILSQLEKLELGSENDSLLGGTTLAPGTTIRGGETMHTIPDRCEATVDIYTVPGQNSKQIVSMVESLMNNMKKEDNDLSAKVETIFETAPYLTQTDQKIYSDLQSAIATVFGRPAEQIGIPSVGDARFMRDLGIPSVVAYGPGEKGKGHITDESVSIETLVKVTKVYALTALRFWSS